jgi:hypothetical protein
VTAVPLQVSPAGVPVFNPRQTVQLSGTYQPVCIGMCAIRLLCVGPWLLGLTELVLSFLYSTACLLSKACLLEWAHVYERIGILYMHQLDGLHILWWPRLWDGVDVTNVCLGVVGSCLQAAANRSREVHPPRGR